MKLPRIRSVKSVLPTSLIVQWEDGRKTRVDLTGWIATGAEILAPLGDPDVFRTARTGKYGASVEWADNEDLAIDAEHLSRIADEQRILDVSELSQWQSANNFTNEEAAALLGVSRSTWASYKTGTNVPPVIVMAVRATQRDPVIIQAHFKPLKGKPGRPREKVS